MKISMVLIAASAATLMIGGLAHAGPAHDQYVAPTNGVLETGSGDLALNAANIPPADHAGQSTQIAEPGRNNEVLEMGPGNPALNVANIPSGDHAGQSTQIAEPGRNNEVIEPATPPTSYAHNTTGNTGVN